MKKLFLSAVAALLVACGSAAINSDPRQQALNATAQTAASLNAAITATRGAVQSGTLKGQDADNAIKALETALTSTKAAYSALGPAIPASGAKP